MNTVHLKLVTDGGLHQLVVEETGQVVADVADAEWEVEPMGRLTATIKVYDVAIEVKRGSGESKV